MKKKLVNLLLVSGSVGLTLILIEALSFIAIIAVNKNLSQTAELTKAKTEDLQSPKDSKFSSLTHKKFRLSRPEPYSSLPEFDSFVKQQWSDTPHKECNSKIYHDGKGFNLIMTDTPDCQSNAIVNGWRRVDNQPKIEAANIYIYGGSTVQSVEVPVNYTIPYYLQDFLIDKSFWYKVHNRGFTTVVTKQQLEFLKKEIIQAGDIVIFYDGGNNKWQGIANNSSNGTIIGTNKNLAAINYIKNLAKKLKSYQLLNLLRKKNHTHAFECDSLRVEDLKLRSNIAFEAYKSDLEKAKDYVENMNGIFLHFMQPNLFSSAKGQSSEYEEKLKRTTPSEMVPMCAGKYLSIGSNLFSERHKELKDNDIESYDISDIFETSDPRRPKGEHFLDWIHITAEGNRVVALEIFQAVESKIKVD